MFEILLDDWMQARIPGARASGSRNKTDIAIYADQTLNQLQQIQGYTVEVSGELLKEITVHA